MLTNKIIVNDCQDMTAAEARQAFEAALAYDAWLNSDRTDKDPRVRYAQFEVHETRIGTIVVNKVWPAKG